MHNIKFYTKENGKSPIKDFLESLEIKMKAKALKYKNDFNRRNLKDQLKDEVLRKEYDRIAPEYEIIRAITMAKKEMGYSQSELAKVVGTDQSRISKLEKGTLNPSLEFLKRLAEGLGKEVHIYFTPKKA